jgi:hypothetical protein
MTISAILFPGLTGVAARLPKTHCQIGRATFTLGDFRLVASGPPFGPRQGMAATLQHDTLAIAASHA